MGRRMIYYPLIFYSSLQVFLSGSHVLLLDLGMQLELVIATQSGGEKITSVCFSEHTGLVYSPSQLYLLPNTVYRWP